jgi:uncharacterized protein (UPF0332 family)
VVVTAPKPVATLLTARRLEQVPADRPSAQLRLARAEEKLDAARKIAAIDVEIAYVTAYDAMRIAVTAHMLSLGYRVRAIAAAHEAVGIYAEAMINSASTGEYQRIRRRRNKSEYDDITIGTADLTADLAHAAAVIQAVRRALRVGRVHRRD